jgi:hypothetical protein
MKRLCFLVICLFVIVHMNASARTTAIGSDAQTQQAAASSGINSTAVSTADSPAQSVPAPSKLRHKSAARAGLSKMKGGVVKEIKATSAFVQQEAAKAQTSDGWLIALVAFGLVVLQLRRKHKSLPQRRIAPYV